MDNYARGEVLNFFDDGSFVIGDVALVNDKTYLYLLNIDDDRDVAIVREDTLDNGEKRLNEITDDDEFESVLKVLLAKNKENIDNLLN